MPESLFNPGTLDRNLENNTTLNMDKFEKELQLEQLKEKGIAVFGSEEKFLKWEKEFNPALQQRPIELLSTEVGIKSINDLLIRIEYGIFS